LPLNTLSGKTTIQTRASSNPSKQTAGTIKNSANNSCCGTCEISAMTGVRLENNEEHAHARTLLARIDVACE
jgi:hypothetical protein